MYDLVLTYSNFRQDGEVTIGSADTVEGLIELAHKSAGNFALGDFGGADVYSGGDRLSDPHEPAMTPDEVEAWAREYLAVPA